SAPTQSQKYAGTALSSASGRALPPSGDREGERPSRRRRPIRFGLEAPSCISEGPPIFRVPGRRVSLRGLRGFGLVDPEDLNGRRGGENLAEGMHPALRVLSRASSPAAELVELIEACQLDLELQSRAATLAACKRHQ